MNHCRLTLCLRLFLIYWFKGFGFGVHGDTDDEAEDMLISPSSSASVDGDEVAPATTATLSPAATTAAAWDKPAVATTAAAVDPGRESPSTRMKWWHIGKRKRGTGGSRPDDSWMSQGSGNTDEHTDTSGADGVDEARENSEQGALDAGVKRDEQEQTDKDATEVVQPQEHRGRPVRRNRPGSMEGSTQGVSYSSRPPTVTVAASASTAAALATRASAPADFSLLQSTMHHMRTSTPTHSPAAAKNPVPREVPIPRFLVTHKASRGVTDCIFQTVEEIKARTAGHADYEEIEDRALEAAQWTNRSIGELMAEIRTHGANNSVTFGVLFQETADKFDALAGLLKTAKKYKVGGLADPPCSPMSTLDAILSAHA
jgi:hypothetical protein